MKHQITRVFTAISVEILVLSLFCQTLMASSGGVFNWYCAHVKDHKRPACGGEMNEIFEYGAYYIDPNPEKKVVYLTFDAGYENGNVEKILDVLKEEGVHGAFFVLGHLITDQPSLIQRMKEEGHLVCNHTYHHKDMTTLDQQTFEQELKSLEDLYREQTGEEMAKFYRPPEGKFSLENLKWAQKMGYSTIFWSFGYPDWDNAKQMVPEKAKEKILSNLHPGEIMLLHPTSDTNAKILKSIIQEIKSQGYCFGTLDELVQSES